MKRVYIPGGPERCLNYRNAVLRCGGSLTETAEEAELLFLTGGGDVEPWRYGAENAGSYGMNPERDENELALLEKFLKDGKQVFGVCRGLQLINVYFGGTLFQDIPSHSQIEGKDSVHGSRTEESFLRELYGEELQINSAHHQAADRLGKGLRVIQRAEDGTVEALIHESLPVLGVQWHPERFAPTGDALIRALMGTEEKVKIF